MKLFKNVLQIEEAPEKIRRQMRLQKILFHAYKYAGVAVIITMGYITDLMMQGIGGLQMDNGVHLLVLFGIYSMINFFLLVFLWFVTESSYYRMEQQFSELWLFLKKDEKKPTNDTLEELRKRYV